MVVNLSFIHSLETSNEAYLDQLTGLMTGPIYIGLNDVFIEGDFIWSDGSPNTYVPPWQSGNPDNAGPTSNQDCAVLATAGNMDDVDCSSIYPYICEMRTFDLMHDFTPSAHVDAPLIMFKQHS